MGNLGFSVPYNNDPETLQEIFRLKKLGKNSIREVYLSGPQEYSGSGRVTPRLGLERFINIVDKIHREGLRVNLIMNPTCGGSDWYSPEVINSTMEYLRQVHEEHGVEAITIANPIYIKEVRRRFPDMEICASVLGDIDSVQRAVIYNKLGANVITPDNNINRDLGLLKAIKEATNAELKLMVNEGCLYRCPFRKFHFNNTSHQSKEVILESNIFFTDCQQIFGEDHSQILKSGWIRPEDTKKYSEITSFFKIVGRGKPKSHVTRTVRAYLEESWEGDLLDILCASLNMFTLENGAFLDNKSLDKYNFFEKVTSCDKNCSQCEYCTELARKLIRLGIMTREKLEDFGLKHVADRLEAKGKLTSKAGMKL